MELSASNSVEIYCKPLIFCGFYSSQEKTIPCCTMQFIVFRERRRQEPDWFAAIDEISSRFYYHLWLIIKVWCHQLIKSQFLKWKIPSRIKRFGRIWFVLKVSTWNKDGAKSSINIQLRLEWRKILCDVLFQYFISYANFTVSASKEF